MSTPILDRERTIPAGKPPSVVLKLLNGAAWVVGGLLGAAAAGPWFPGFRAWVEAIYIDWFRSRLDDGAGAVRVVLLAIAAYYAAVAIHELGHVIAGRLAGYRFREIRVGPIVISRSSRPYSISVSLWRGPGGAFTGHAVLSPVRTDHLAWREVTLSIGGPLAEVLTAFVLLAMPGKLPLFGGYLVMFSLAVGLATMVPAETPGGYTDGRKVAIQFGGDPRGARHNALILLRRDLAAGVAANRSNPQLFRDATAVRDETSDTALAHMMAFQRAWLGGQRDEAGEYIETGLAFSRHVSESMREAIRSEAATYLAKHRRRIDLAEQWLAEISNPPIRPWNRVRPEAAILEAKGDIPGAIAKVGDVERAMSVLPAGGIRDLSLAELHDWRAELESLAPAISPA